MMTQTKTLEADREGANRETVEPHSDINTHTWISYLPATVRPYLYLARMDRPIGIWLLALPGWWSIVLASGGWSGMSAHSWLMCALFGLGAVVMRAAGCVINDVWDRDLDKQVERTRTRPLAAGDISLRSALLFLVMLLLAGLMILLQMNTLTIILGFAVLPLIIVYPLMKRVTWWPQAFLGLTFNFGALMGWSAVTGSLSVTSLILYAACMFWTLGYDTIYAHQDKEDDALVGIKSTARLFNKKPKKPVAWFYGLHFILLTSCVLLSGGYVSFDGFWSAILLDDSFAFIGLYLAALHLSRQMSLWFPEDQQSALRIFKSNRSYGLLVLLAFFLV